MVRAFSLRALLNKAARVLRMTRVAFMLVTNPLRPSDLVGPCSCGNGAQFMLLLHAAGLQIKPFGHLEGPPTSTGATSLGIFRPS